MRKELSSQSQKPAIFTPVFKHNEAHLGGWIESVLSVSRFLHHLVSKNNNGKIKWLMPLLNTCSVDAFIWSKLGFTEEITSFQIQGNIFLLSPALETFLLAFFLYINSSVIVMKNNLPLLIQYFDLTFFTVSGYGTA